MKLVTVEYQAPLSEIERLEEIWKRHRHRKCGVCGVANIPRGVDWPVWVEGKPAHRDCAAIILGAAAVKVTFD